MKNWKTFAIVGIWVILALNILSLNSCDFVDSEKTPEVFTVKNNTGDYLSTIYLREPGTSVWGVGSSVYLSSGSSTTVNISPDRMDSQYRTDIQLRTSNGNLYTKLSQQLTHEGTVTFTSSDLDSESPRTVSIGNSTGDYLSTIYLRVPGTSVWGVGSSVYLSDNHYSTVTISIDKMDSQYRTDIQLRTSNGNLYTKLSQPLTHNGSVTFSSNDLDGESPRTVAIGNSTGDYLSTIYLKVPGTLVWGTGSSVYLSNDGYTSVTISKDRMDDQYRTDIQLRTSNGNLYTKLSQPITHNGSVTFTNRDLDAESPRTVTIGNATGDYLSTIYLRETGTSVWSTGSSVYLSNGGTTTVTIPIERMNSQYRADIQLRASGDVNYTKLSQPIIHNGTITFTSNDKN
jgi:ribosome-associated translation inhibitor RaiA